MESRRQLHLAYTVRKVIEYQKPYYLFEKLKWVEDTRFSQSGNLNRHMRVHGNMSGGMLG
ncbi:hypothetical protein MSG28_014306 [Choristoneura fumiferana]|uniref:Uncharacterized protein n=1 Tax=Choristoneura fumiferana TaxID=7141 RepID=A0ACC0JGM4_CHOFU|nr:hypothetical protein MSG28_014306 [Choristoneura fumiferana]